MGSKPRPLALKCKKVPYANKRREGFIQLHEEANGAAHMSVRLILSSYVEREKCGLSLDRVCFKSASVH